MYVYVHWERGQSGEKARRGRLKEKDREAEARENGGGKKTENRNRTKQEGTATEERAARQIEKEGPEDMTRWRRSRGPTVPLYPLYLEPQVSSCTYAMIFTSRPPRELSTSNMVPRVLLRDCVRHCSNTGVTNR